MLWMYLRYYLLLIFGFIDVFRAVFFHWLSKQMIFRY